MQKFVMAIKKHDKFSAGRCEGHNTRAHHTASQLPKEAWLTEGGSHEVAKWRGEVLERAKGLAKRKDAVVAIELVLQVGNQSDWRHPPTAEHPAGKPIEGRWEDMKKLARAAQAAAEAEFGKENIVGVDLHTDESTPHVHVVVTPVVNGKLQAKNWLNGPAMCAALRKRVYAVVNNAIACEYTPGAEGGKKHDPSKAAGKTPLPKPSPLSKVPVLAPLVEFVDDRGRLKKENEDLHKAIRKVEVQCQKLFSQLKSLQERALGDFRKKDEAIAKIAKERRAEREARLEAEAKLEEVKARERERVVALENRLAEALAERDELRRKDQVKYRSGFTPDRR